MVAIDNRIRIIDVLNGDVVVEVDVDVCSFPGFRIGKRAFDATCRCACWIASVFVGVVGSRGRGMVSGIHAGGRIVVVVVISAVLTGGDSGIVDGCGIGCPSVFEAVVVLINVLFQVRWLFLLFQHSGIARVPMICSAIRRGGGRLPIGGHRR